MVACSSKDTVSEVREGDNLPKKIGTEQDL